MKTQHVLTSVIVILFGVITWLGVVILTPEPPEPELTYYYIMNKTLELRNNIQAINLTYEVNLTLPNQSITGYITYQQTPNNKKVTYSPTIQEYSEKDLLLPPQELINFIQDNTRREYSGELINVKLNKTCWSLITEPRVKNSIQDGEHLFVTCFDQDTGYPSVNYNGEIKNDTVIHSNVYITNQSYELV